MTKDQYKKAVNQLEKLLKDGVIGEQDFDDMENYFYSKQSGSDVSCDWMETHPRELIGDIEQSL